MANSLRFFRQSATLTWTVLQALADYRRRGSSRLTLNDRAEWLHHWCAICLRRLDITINVKGSPPPSGLLVSNHLSYLDILVFSAVVPCVFVSKSEVKNWPVFGTMATLSGTVYIDRTRKSDTRNANDGIRNALEQGLRVVIFPEGGSSDGSSILPFYPSLFEPAVENNTPITAAHIEYQLQEGSVGKDVAYWGDMTFFPHLVRLLSRRGLRAGVQFAESSRTFEDRKMAALQMRAEVLQLRS
jgi:1-acyl-sn-glycerol-3-phosphate acyltransferase